MAGEKHIHLPPEIDSKYVMTVLCTGNDRKAGAAMRTYRFPLSFLDPEQRSGKPESRTTAPYAAIEKVQTARENHRNPKNNPTLFVGMDTGIRINNEELHQLSRDIHPGDKKARKQAEQETIELFNRERMLTVEWIFAAALLSHDLEIQKVAALHIRLLGDPVSPDKIKKAFKNSGVLYRNSRLEVIEDAKEIMGKYGSLIVRDEFQPDGEVVPIKRKKAETLIVSNLVPQLLLDQLCQSDRTIALEGTTVRGVLLDNIHGIIRS